MLTGGSFLSGALTGAAGSAMGSLTGLIPGIQTNGWGTAVQVGSSAAFGGIVADLSGGNFWSGAAQAAIIAGFNHTAHTIYERIAATAEKYIGSDDWAYETEKDNFRMRTNKCNKFVYDVLREAGAETKFTRYGLSYDLVPLSKDRPYLAGEWGNPDAVVTNWKVIRNPRRGDIAAYKAPYSDATGHVGIVTGSGKGVWANGFVIRQDYINNKVWDTSHTIIYRRYVGPAK